MHKRHETTFSAAKTFYRPAELVEILNMPAIMLKGQWLRDLGFEENTPIVVHCEGGKLTITRADEVEASFTEISAEPAMCVAEAGGAYGRCKAMMNRFYDAWQFLAGHPVFVRIDDIIQEPSSWYFMRNLDIEVVKVNPFTNMISDKEAENTKAVVWLECGTNDDHDLDLDCG